MQMLGDRNAGQSVKASSPSAQHSEDDIDIPFGENAISKKQSVSEDDYPF
jgi:hypothetical protein